MVDTSSGSSSVPTDSRKRIAQALHKAQLVDVWRLQHSGERDYMFYSSPHKIYTRIDYFLIPHVQLHAVHASSIGQRTWSDHAPISLTYALSDSPSQRTRFWWLNESLLQRPEVLEEVTRELHFYFQTNTTADCNSGIVWEAHKPAIREILIKHGAWIKRERERQLELLLSKLHTVESQHKCSPPLDTELTSLRAQINDLL